MMRTDDRGDRGAAVVDFCLIMVVLLPLVLGVIQIGLVLHVRNTLTAAASEGARHAAAIDGTAAGGEARTRALISESVGETYARDVEATDTDAAGAAAVEVRIEAEVPALGFFGPGIKLDIAGHAIKEQEP